MWVAIYKDQSMLQEIDPDGKEHLFKEIDQDKLFSMELLIGNKQYGVCLQSGAFRVGDEICNFAGLDTDDSFKLIYFRRVKQSLGDNGGASTTHHLGWQSQKTHKKIIMCVEEDTQNVTFEVTNTMV
jgi:hypothetical protein